VTDEKINEITAPSQVVCICGQGVVASAIKVGQSIESRINAGFLRNSSLKVAIQLSNVIGKSKSLWRWRSCAVDALAAAWNLRSISPTIWHHVMQKTRLDEEEV
jgi:hypothetical protein